MYKSGCTFSELETYSICNTEATSRPKSTLLGLYTFSSEKNLPSRSQLATVRGFLLI
jgi:hypothetical protein